MKSSIVNEINWENYLDNPFVKTYWAPYLALHPKRKGSVGEAYVSTVLKDLGHDIKPRTCSGHDLIIDGWKTEIKFSLASKGKKDYFTWNHLSRKKNYDRALLVGINIEECDRWKWFTREDFCNRWSEGFSYQQGGVKAENDDFMMLGNATSLMVLDWIYDFDIWTKLE